jgi:hypothetical protein
MTTRAYILVGVVLLTMVDSTQAGMFSRLRNKKPDAPAAVQEESRDGDDASAAVARFQRQWEPRERAYSFLVPTGWTVEGGLFHVDPTQANGTANSIEAKCDLAVKKDAAGTVMFRWLPAWNYCDMTQNPQFNLSAGFFPVGSRYQGMEVRPMPNAAGFLQGLFQTLHPAATDVNVVEIKPIPELVEVFTKMYKAIDDYFRSTGSQPLRYDAGGMTVEYSEGGVRFREGLVTCLMDMRYAAAIWSNQHTLMLRAPADQAKQWKPTLDIIRQSVRLNPEWVAAAMRASNQRAQISLDTQRYIQSIDQQIFEHRSQTNSRINYEDYLVLTSQEEYVNPFTKEVERDTSEYKYRWTTEQGEMIYTDLNNFNPNAQRELSNREWKLTPVRER